MKKSDVNKMDATYGDILSVLKLATSATEDFPRIKAAIDQLNIPQQILDCVMRELEELRARNAEALRAGDGAGLSELRGAA